MFLISCEVPLYNERKPCAKPAMVYKMEVLNLYRLLTVGLAFGFRGTWGVPMAMKSWLQWVLTSEQCHRVNLLKFLWPIAKLIKNMKNSIETIQCCEYTYVDPDLTQQWASNSFTACYRRNIVVIMMHASRMNMMVHKTQLLKIDTNITSHYLIGLSG